jgi:N-acetylmuramoyl-L-alanine amidase
MIYQGRAGYIVRNVVIHGTRTPTDWHAGKSAVEMIGELRRLDVEAYGLRNVRYHGLIAPSGDFAQGRALREIGAGVRRQNRGVVHVCLVPIREITRVGQFNDWYTQAQRIALRDYLFDLEWLTGPGLEVSGHHCGFPVDPEEWL